MLFSYAQESLPSDTTNKIVKINEVVISAFRYEEQQLETSPQIEILNKNSIKKLNAQTTADLLQNSGALFVQRSQQGGGSPVIRGFEANRVLLMIDGVRMNNLIYRAGHLQNIITADQNSLERVEVLYGPASSIYGTDALGGVIHLYTLSPELDQKSGNAFFRYSSVNNEMTTHADINWGNTKYASMTSFTYSHFGDLIMGKAKGVYDSVWGKRYFYVERVNGKDSMMINTNPYKQTYSGYKQYDFVHKLLFVPNENDRYITNIQISTTSDIPRYDRLTDIGSDQKAISARWDYGPQFRGLISSNYSHTFHNRFFNRLNITTNYQHLEESRITRGFEKANLRTQLEKVNTGGLNMTLLKIMKKQTWQLGFESYVEFLNSTAKNFNINSLESKPASTRYPDGDNHRETLALYFTHQYFITNKWILNDGVRAEYIRLYSKFITKEFFPFPFDEVIQHNIGSSANVGLVFLPNDKTKVGLLLCSGYRSPNVDDLSKVFETKPKVQLIVPNPDIKPEKSYNVELTVTRFFGSRVRWENVGYYTWLRDVIVVDRFMMFNGDYTTVYAGDTVKVYAAQNKGRAFICGFNSNIRSDIGNHFSASASVTYTYGRIQTDSANVPLDHIPPLYARVSAHYYNSRFNSELFILMNGKKNIKDYLLNAEDNEKYATPMGMPAWYVLNLHIGYQLTKNVMLQAGIDNILDQNYRVFSSGIQAPGRNLFTNLRLSF